MKTYAICGVSNRAFSMFIRPLCGPFSNTGKIVALLDPDPLRFEVCARMVPETKGLPCYGAEDFERMVAEQKPQVIIVAGADHSHVEYILAALASDLDVIVEKPMTTTAADARRVLEAEAKSKGRVTVTFNYRYTAPHRRLKELLLEGRIGRVTYADLNWYIDTYHGASYFKRWNRRREASGGLSIHKCSHHFDLLNWWLGQVPVEVFAYGARNHYGPEGEMNPRKVDGRHCGECPDRTDCSYVMRWQPHRHSEPPKDDHLSSVAGKVAGNYSNYRPDQCIFDSEIDIEDTYVVSLRYAGGAMATYSVGFSQPYEGYRLAISGTRGRLETQEYHAPARTPFNTPVQTITCLPLFDGAREVIEPLQREGGHGGADPIIREDLFLGADPKRGYEILSGSRDGALAVATGEAVWRSVQSGKPVNVLDLLGDLPGLPVNQAG